MVDCANGAAYNVGPAVFKELGAKVIPLYNTPDGLNINEDCGSTHPEQLQQAVVEHQADLGIAFDGDADRVIMVDKMVSRSPVIISFIFWQRRPKTNRQVLPELS